MRGLSANGSVAGVGHQPVQLADGVNGGQLLVQRRVLLLVLPLVRQPVADLNGAALQRDPRLEGAVARHVLQGPLHRDRLDVERLAVVLLLQQLRGVAVHVAGADRVPGPFLPGRVRRAERPGAGVVRLADPPAEVVDVDDVAALLDIGEVADAPAPVEVHADPDDAVVEVGHALRAVPERTFLAGQAEGHGDDRYCKNNNAFAGLHLEPRPSSSKPCGDHPAFPPRWGFGPFFGKDHLTL